MCNYMVSSFFLPRDVDRGRDIFCRGKGNERWLGKLQTKFQQEFINSKAVPWVTFKSGRTAGEVRSAGSGGFGAGNVTFVNIYEAG